jgi:hypothetical protein
MYTLADGLFYKDENVFDVIIHVSRDVGSAFIA